MYTGNFQLYRNGEWAITNPIGYGKEPVSGPAANTVLPVQFLKAADHLVLDSPALGHP